MYPMTLLSFIGRVRPRRIDGEEQTLAFTVGSYTCLRGHLMSRQGICGAYVSTQQHTCPLHTEAMQFF